MRHTGIWGLHFCLCCRFCLFLPIMLFSSQWWLSVMLFLSQKLTAHWVKQTRFLISSLDKSTFERDSTPVMDGERKRKRLFHGNKCRITCKKIISFIPVHVSLGCLWNCAHFPLVLCFASGCRPIMYAKLCICINKISFLQVSLYVSGRNLLVKLVMTFLFCVAEKKQNTVSPQPQCRQCLKFDRSLQGQQLTNKTSRRYKDFKEGATRDGVNYLMSQST